MSFFGLWSPSDSQLKSDLDAKEKQVRDSVMKQGTPYKKSRKDISKQRIDPEKLKFLYGGFCVLNQPSSINRRQAPRPAIIFDLDQTLVMTLGGDDEDAPPKPKALSPDHRNRIYDISDMDGMWGWVRPGGKELAKYCHDHHEPTLVWTAGADDYGPRIVSIVFGENAPKQVFTRKACREDPKGGKTLQKPILSLCSTPGKKGLDPSNLLMIDDNVNAFSEECLRNVILVPAYVPSSDTTRPDPDNVLPRLMDWLIKMSYSGPEDVREWSCVNLFDISEFNKN